MSFDVVAALALYCLYLMALLAVLRAVSVFVGLVATLMAMVHRRRAVEAATRAYWRRRDLREVYPPQ